MSAAQKPDTPRGTFIVVSDRVGFVGAYPTVAAAQKTLRPFLGVPLAYGEWSRHAAAPAAVDAKDSEAGAPGTDRGARAAAAAASDAVARVADADASLADADARVAAADARVAAANASLADADARVAAADARLADARVAAADARLADGGAGADPGGVDATAVAPPDTETVWILPYKGSNAVACASNSKAVVEEAQRVLLGLDLVHSDDVMYWEAAMGETHGLAEKRLAAVVEAFMATAEASAPATAAAAAKDQEVVSDFLRYAARGEAAAETAAAAEKRTDILESVIPRDLFGGGGAGV